MLLIFKIVTSLLQGDPLGQPKQNWADRGVLKIQVYQTQVRDSMGHSVHQKVCTLPRRRFASAQFCAISLSYFNLSFLSYQIRIILIQRAHKAPMKEIKTSSDLFQVEMTLMSQVHLLRTSISTLLNESPKI